MLENYLITRCERTFNKSCAGKCENCDNPDGCSGSCVTCLEQVHWYPDNGGRSDYTCELLLLKYILNFTDRYKNQVLSIDSDIDLARYPRYDIFSIGCGATPDLMAFEEMTIGSGKPIYYKGYDKNSLWRPIHELIEKYTKKQDYIDASLWQRDIFDVFSEGKPRNHKYNIVIIQYLISHLFNTDQDGQIIALYDYILDNILKRSSPDTPFLIAIFDIDSMNKGRNQWYLLLDKLEQKGYRGNAFARSFYPNGDLGIERWSKNKLSKNFGNIVYHYQQNDSDHDCAQLVIELE